MTAASAAVDTNPFVGPRALRAGEAIHGRDREIRRLTNLLVAERIVLLYSPSGAGKTSLIEAGLIPRLRQRRFQVSPVIRVSHLPAEHLAYQNRYLASTLQALEAGLRPDDQRPVEELLAMGLEGYVRDWATPGDQDPGDKLLIFDQFEEVLVLDPGDTEVKRAFFQELGGVLEERGRWALFSMREDYIAGLDPYLSELPTRLHTRMRLDLLPPEAALQAVQMPAAAAGRPFQETAAEKLVHDLRLVQAQRGGEIIQVPGPFVEPLQLQVVCRRLWDALPEAEEINEADVERFARVGAALGGYYAEEVREVADASGVPERAIREWFGRELITDQGVRRQQQRGPGTDGAAAEKAVRLLENAHLIRAEARRGTRWLELAHDQLVRPLQADNERWAREHLSTAQHQAQQWASHNRSGDFLLTGNSLVEARRWAAENPAELTELETSFLAASTEADNDRRWRRRISITLGWLSALLVVALMVAADRWYAAERANEDATARLNQAMSRAGAVRANALAADDPLRAVYVAERALERADTPEAEDALRQAMSQDLPTAILNHGDNVTSVAFSPGGDRIATTSWDGTVRIWDSRTGTQMYSHEYDAAVFDARFTPDRSAILVLTEDKTLMLWRPDDPGGEMVKLVAAGVQLPLAISDDGSRIAAVDAANDDVRVFDAVRGTDAGPPLVGAGTDVNAIALSPNGGLLAAAGQDGRARVFDTAAGHQAAVLEGHERGVTQVAFRRDAGAIATGDGEGRARVWSLPVSGPPRVIDAQAHGSANVAFAPTGQLLAYGDKSPQLFDGSTGTLIRSFNGHRSWVHDARFSQDGRRMITPSDDGTARVWDVPSGREVAVLRGSHGNVNLAAVAPGGDVAAVATGSSVRLFTLHHQFFPSEHADWVLNAVFLPGGQAIAAGGHNGQVTVWDTATTAVLAKLVGPQVPIQHVDVDSTGTYISVANADGTVLVWDWHRGVVVAQKVVMTTAASVSFDPSGDLLVVAGDSAVLTWRWRSLEEPQKLFPDFSATAVFSPNGRYVATDRGGLLQLWTPDGAELQTLSGHTDNIRDIEFSRDGNLIATASLDGTVGIWTWSFEHQQYQLLSRLEGRHGALQSVALDDAGTRVAAGGDDGFVEVWDVDERRPLASLHRHSDAVNSVQFASGAGEVRILSASDDSTVQMFKCATCGHLDEVRARATSLIASQGWTRQPAAVGECYKRFSRSQQPVSCRSMHRDEVFAVLSYPGPEDAPFPTSGLDDWARNECQGEPFREYRGKAYDDDPDFYAWWIAPTAVEWDMGQRSVVCVLTMMGDEEPTQSARQPR